MSAAWTVHSEYLQRRWRAPCLSCACFLYLVIGTVMALLPLYMGIASHSFWVTRDVYYEQPRVVFTDQLLVYVEGVRGAGRVPFTGAWASDIAAGNALGEQLRSATVKARSTDFNHDGRTDELLLSVSLAMASDEVVHRAVVIGAVQYQLMDRTHVSIDGLFYVDASNAMGGAGVNAVGRLRLRQFEALPVNKIGYKPYVGAPALPFASPGYAPPVLTSADLLPFGILQAYARRNLTTVLVGEAVWESDFVGLLRPAGGYKFNVVVDINVGIESVIIIPGVAEAVKFAWVQYAAIWALVYACAWLARSYVYGERIVEARIVADAAPQRPHAL